MPLYRYICPVCGTRQARMLDPKLAKSQQACRSCGEVLQRVRSVPSTIVKETLDNGIMTKRVERVADAERLHKERSAHHAKSKS